MGNDLDAGLGRRESSSLSTSGPGAARPNLLFIMTDQQKATSLDLYNRECNFIRTEALRGLAEEGVVFENAYCPYPLCVPSRIAMFRGQYPTRSGYITNGAFIDEGHETIFSRAKEQGYRSFLVGKDHAYCRIHGVGGEKGRHPAHLDRVFDRLYLAGNNAIFPDEIRRDLPHVKAWMEATPSLKLLWRGEAAPWTAERSLSARLVDVAMEYLDGWAAADRPGGVPFSMWLSFPDPHEYYQAPRDVYDLIDPAEITLPPNWDSDIDNRSEYIRFMHWYYNAGGPPEEMARELTRVYLAMCKNVDLQLVRMFDYLRQNGLWEDTVIVYTSDHGDLCGEHRLLQKFNCAYDGCARVPLIVSWPGRTPGGARCVCPVNLVDLPSTLCELMGLDRLSEDQGESLAPIALGQAQGRRPYTVVESGIPGKGLSTRDIRNFPGHRYDIDPVGRFSYNPPHRFAGKLYAVRSRDHKLIVRQGQAAELYDMKNDPWETRNVMADPKYTEVVLEHYGYLVEHLARLGHKAPGSRIAPHDRWYTPGGDKTWDEVVPEEVKRG